MAEFNAGPLEPHVLYDQENHISDWVWDFQEQRAQRVQNCTSNVFLKSWVLSKRQEQLVKDAGFGFLLRAGNIMKTDVSLLNALYERWRPETNTFHLPVGECTITLEDVGMILGTPIGFRPITARPTKANTTVVFKHLLNLQAIPDDKKNSEGIFKTYLRELFGRLPPGSTEEQEDIAVKAFLLDGIVSVLLPDGKKSAVHRRYAEFVADLAEVINYAWNAAILAHTYRGLYKATRLGSKYFQGCTTLVQVWAWMRISIGRPLPRPDSDFEWPRVRAYAYDTETNDTYKKGYETNPNHTPTSYFRGELDMMDCHAVFVWDPYTAFFSVENLVIVKYFRSWAKCNVPLIHFAEVEWQLPERVVRQFGMPIEIPEDPQVQLRHYRPVKENDFEKVDPIDLWSAEIDRFMEVVHNDPWTCEYKGNPDRQLGEVEYFRWYRRITRIRINPPTIDKGPSDEFYPRNVIRENPALSLLMGAGTLVKRMAQHVPVADNQLRQDGRCWGEGLQQFSQQSVDPSFTYGVFDQEGQQSQQSNVTDEYITPFRSVPQEVPNNTAPGAPEKDKGKRPIREQQPAGGQTFDLGNADEYQPHVMGYDDGNMYRVVPAEIVNWVDNNWFSKEGNDALQPVEMLGVGRISIATLKCLAPSEELWEQVVTAYIKLLIAREKTWYMLGTHPRRTFWVADPSFMHLCESDRDKLVAWEKKRGNKPQWSFNNNILALLDGRNGDQPAINQGRDYALIPFLHHLGSGSNHYSLFCIDLGKLTVMCIDSLFRDRPYLLDLYKKELKIVYHYLVTCWRDVFQLQLPAPTKKVSKTSPFHVLKGPRQTNGTDCGVFMLKAMDQYLRDSGDLPNEWSTDEITRFRYWMAWELYQNRARG